LSYLGGLWVMIELNIEETKMKLLQHTGVNSWFEELKPASQEFVEESDVEEVSGTIFEVSPQAPHVDVHKVNEKANSHHLDDPFASHQDPIHSNSAHLEVNQDEPPIAKGSSLKSYTKASYFSQASQGNDSSADSSIHVSSRSTPKGGSILEVLGGMIKVGRSMGYDMEGCSKDIEQIIRLQGEADGIK
nr:RNA-directed DNA polymerase, eukaryota, nucleotide-binding alpha-beta plait domain protein [Tanacetum cinerariifolium]